MIASEFDGQFPGNEAELQKLPGIGAYTSAAITAIAFDRRATAIDGNVERVIARLFAVEEPLPGAKISIRVFAEQLVPADRPGDYTQAMMDLGATICAPRTPACLRCPIQRHCVGYAKGIAATLPVKPPKKERPIRYGTAFLAIRDDGAVMLRRRPPKGLLGGMLEVPSSEWLGQRTGWHEAKASAPLSAPWQSCTAPVGHTFTHFHLELDVYRATGIEAGSAPPQCRWYPQADLPDEALPSVMRKVLARGLEGR
jgi:A/G-specific adenine glycosylase